MGPAPPWDVPRPAGGLVSRPLLSTRMGRLVLVLAGTRSWRPLDDRQRPLPARTWQSSPTELRAQRTAWEYDVHALRRPTIRRLAEPLRPFCGQTFRFFHHITGPSPRSTQRTLGSDAQTRLRVSSTGALRWPLKRITECHQFPRGLRVLIPACCMHARPWRNTRENAQSRPDEAEHPPQRRQQTFHRAAGINSGYRQGAPASPRVAYTRAETASPCSNRRSLGDACTNGSYCKPGGLRAVIRANITYQTQAATHCHRPWRGVDAVTARCGQILPVRLTPQPARHSASARRCHSRSQIQGWARGSYQHDLHGHQRPLD